MQKIIGCVWRFCEKSLVKSSFYELQKNKTVVHQRIKSNALGRQEDKNTNIVLDRAVVCVTR